jgi:hypothetical protein
MRRIMLEVSIMHEAKPICHEEHYSEDTGPSKCDLKFLVQVT